MQSVSNSNLERLKVAVEPSLAERQAGFQSDRRSSSWDFWEKHFEEKKKEHSGPSS